MIFNTNDTAEMIKHVKDRRPAMGSEFEIILTDKLFDIGSTLDLTKQCTFAEMTNDPAKWGILNHTGKVPEPSENIFFVRVVTAEERFVKANIPTNVEVVAFYILDFGLSSVIDQTANLF